jgi:hypothetical protein
MQIVLWWGLESGGWFCVDMFGRNLASVTMKLFSYLIYFIKKFYEFCTFIAICKCNAAIKIGSMKGTPGNSRITQGIKISSRKM